MSTPASARLRLTATPAGLRLWLARRGTGEELACIGTYATTRRAGLAIRGTLERAGWCPLHDGPPGLIVREVEINVPLRAAILEGESR